jgi:predicted PurR-regulated permease PerM
VDKHDPAPAEGGSDSTMGRQAVRSVGLAATTMLGGALCVLVVYPLLAPILWATVLAIVTRPLHRRIERHVRRPSAAAALIVGAVALLIAMPFALIAAQLLREAAEVTDFLKSGEASRLWRELLERERLLSTVIHWVERHADLQSLVGQWTGGTAKLLHRLLSGSIAGAAGWLIMFFMLFFLVRDRVRMLSAVERLLPLSRAEVREVVGVTVDTVHATVWGTIAVGLFQGTLGGLVFWWLGLPAPFVWGAVMAVLSLLPVLGAAIVWLPVSAYLALNGQWHDALALAAFGAIVIGLIDNLVYPLIVKDRLHLHAVPVFVSIIGGLIVFGASGVVLGPLLLVVTDTLVRIWRRRLGIRDGGANAEAADSTTRS